MRWVEYNVDKGNFSATVQNLIEDHSYTEEFDHVIVASGHFSTPNIPTFEGLETFNGHMMHAHHFRDALEFKDKNILIIGSNYSGGGHRLTVPQVRGKVRHLLATGRLRWAFTGRKTPSLCKIPTLYRVNFSENRHQHFRGGTIRESREFNAGWFKQSHCPREGREGATLVQLEITRKSVTCGRVNFPS